MRESRREKSENGGLERGGRWGVFRVGPRSGSGWNVDDGPSKTSERILGREKGSKVACRCRRGAHEVRGQVKRLNGQTAEMSVDKCMRDRPKDGTDGEVCLVASRKSSRRMPKSPRARGPTMDKARLNCQRQRYPAC